jgi:hypothetical protein
MARLSALRIAKTLVQTVGRNYRSEQEKDDRLAGNGNHLSYAIIVNSEDREVGFCSPTVAEEKLARPFLDLSHTALSHSLVLWPAMFRPSAEPLRAT